MKHKLCRKCMSITPHKEVTELRFDPRNRKSFTVINYKCQICGTMY